MFLNELKRLENMIGEVVFPTEATKSDPKVQFGNKNAEFFVVKYDPKLSSHVAVYDSQRGDVRFKISIYCKRASPNDMDSIESNILVKNVFIEKRRDLQVQRHVSSVPDVQFLEDMEMSDIEQIAMKLLRNVRSMMRTVNERSQNDDTRKA